MSLHLGIVAYGAASEYLGATGRPSEHDYAAKRVFRRYLPLLTATASAARVTLPGRTSIENTVFKAVRGTQVEAHPVAFSQLGAAF